MKNQAMLLVNNALSTSIFEANKAVGWWDNPRKDGETIALIHSEISEAYEALVGGMPRDEHVPQFSNWAVELADAAIRIYDFAGFKGWDLELATGYHCNAMFRLDPGYQICELHALVTKALEGIRRNTVLPECGGMDAALYHLAGALIHIYEIGIYDNLPMVDVINAKLAYNAQRADHKRENRAKADGKKI